MWVNRKRCTMQMFMEQLLMFSKYLYVNITVTK